VFAGISADSADVVLDRSIKELTNFRTINEVRAKFDLPKLKEEDGGDLILNSNWISVYNNKKIMEQQNNTGGIDGEEQEVEEYDPTQDDEDIQQSIETNPFIKDLKKFAHVEN
jgi:hypothetical protein